MKKRRIGARVWAAAALGLGGGLLAAACGSDECDPTWEDACAEQVPCPGACATTVYLDSFGFNANYYWFGKLEDRPSNCGRAGGYEGQPLFFGVKAGARCPGCRCKQSTCTEEIEFHSNADPNCDPSSDNGGTNTLLSAECNSLYPPSESELTRIRVAYGQKDCYASTDEAERMAAFESVVIPCHTRLYAGIHPDQRDICEQSGQHCLEIAPPSGFRRCMEYLGSEPPEKVMCPSPYTDQEVAYREVKGCSSCDCEATGSLECEITVSLFQGDRCNDPVPSDDTVINPECLVPPALVSERSVRANILREKPATCTPTGGEQTGEIAPSNPTVLCCEPLDG